jgi:hypothetical protein
VPIAAGRSSISVVRSFVASRRYSLPLAGACVCFFAASIVAPIVAWVLIIAAFGLVLDAGTAWLAKAGSTGGMRDYKQ